MQHLSSNPRPVHRPYSRCRPEESTTTASEASASASATPSAYSLYALCIGPGVGGVLCAHVSHGYSDARPSDRCVCIESTKQIKFYSTLLSTFMHSEVTRRPATPPDTRLTKPNWEDIAAQLRLAPKCKLPPITA